MDGCNFLQASRITTGDEVHVRCSGEKLCVLTHKLWLGNRACPESLPDRVRSRSCQVALLFIDGWRLAASPGGNNLVVNLEKAGYQCFQVSVSSFDHHYHLSVSMGGSLLPWGVSMTAMRLPIQRYSYQIPIDLFVTDFPGITLTAAEMPQHPSSALRLHRTPLLSREQTHQTSFALKYSMVLVLTAPTDMVSCQRCWHERIRWTLLWLADKEKYKDFREGSGS
jgi:hypothetical protein